MSVEDIWRNKSNEEVRAAAAELSNYKEEAQQIIRVEMQRRGIPIPPPPIPQNPRYGTFSDFLEIGSSTPTPEETLKEALSQTELIEHRNPAVARSMDGRVKSQIRQALAKIQVINISGLISAQAYIDPPDVKRFEWMNSNQYWKFTVEQAVNPILIAPYNHGIFLGRLVFPCSCCKCMRDTTHFTLIEAGIRVVQWPVLTSHKTTIYGYGWGDIFRGEYFRDLFAGPRGRQTKDQRIANALTEQRYWYTVPFCSDHNLKSEAIAINGKMGEIGLHFANRAYGELFAQHNESQGRLTHIVG